MEIGKLPRRTYYYSCSSNKKADKYEQVKKEISRIFTQENKCRRGYRAITAELRKTQTINHKTVQRLMREMGLYCMVRAKKYCSYKSGVVGEVAENILKRDFTANRPNEKWVTDVTEFHLFGEKLYLSTIMDLFNREIISYTIAPRPRMSLVMNMLDNAISKLPCQRGELVLHSDQGWHYKTKAYQRKLKANGIVQSMSRKATCLDNAVMENFFGILKSELLYLQDFDSVEHFVEELHQYIWYYNNRRIKERCGYMSPVEFRSLIA